MTSNELSERRVENLISYIACLLRGDDIREAYQQHCEEFEGLESPEVFRAFWQILEQGYQARDVIEVVPRVILATQRDDDFTEVRPDDPFLQDLRAENRSMMDLLAELRPLFRQERSDERDRAIVELMQGLREVKAHFVRLQNIFFPTLEQKDEALSALTLLWAWHDEAEKILEQTLAAFSDSGQKTEQLNRMCGKLFGFYASMPFKEERLLYMVADEMLDESDWDAMYRQSRAYPTAFDVREEVEKVDFARLKEDAAEGQFSSLTGSMNFEQLNLVLNNLPVDFTVVDENDRVLYFNNPPDRIFPRSPAIVGREVKNCHPPNSLDKVEEIIDAFCEGRKSHARFWIEAKGRKLLIEYFALRDPDGKYRGVLEVSQDITELQSLEGSRRLAEWKD
ncbi:MAG: PAS domain-containing protein [Eubacteriales bacterium]|nr:PAS domain-containing protein [Eubacteriales bacterium]